VRIGVDTTFLVQVSVREHPDHAEAGAMLERLLGAGDRLFLAPQVMAEFVHVVTDACRFEHPMTAGKALDRARVWWDAEETGHVSPTPESVALFWTWMREFRLGRKRLLDTLLAATYFSHQIHAIVSTNARDFGTFGCFQVLVPGLDRPDPAPMQ
jgi:predicted nucleic acid-binding protein